MLRYNDYSSYSYLSNHKNSPTKRALDNRPPKVERAPESKILSNVFLGLLIFCWILGNGGWGFFTKKTCFGELFPKNGLNLSGHARESELI